MSDDPTSGPARIILVGGGARSGKSRFALARARRLGARRVFVATGQALDAEMAERIALHVRTRGDDFRTVEEPLALPEALISLGGGGRASDASADVVVVDCLTLWLSNLICRGDSEAVVAEQVDALGAALARAASTQSWSATRSAWASCPRRRSRDCSAMSWDARTSGWPRWPTKFTWQSWGRSCGCAPSRWRSRRPMSLEWEPSKCSQTLAMGCDGGPVSAPRDSDTNKEPTT